MAGLKAASKVVMMVGLMEMRKAVLLADLMADWWGNQRVDMKVVKWAAKMADESVASKVERRAGLMAVTKAMSMVDYLADCSAD